MKPAANLNKGTMSCRKRELAALTDAVESAAEEGACFDLLDIERVEAFWQQVDPCSVAHGFVLTLREGSRVYLQHITATGADKPVEEVTVLPIAGARYPDLRGGGIVWLDEVEDLNRCLKPRRSLGPIRQLTRIGPDTDDGGMSDPATNAAQYRQQAASKRELAAKVTDAAQKKQLLEEAQALDDLAQTLEVGAPG